MEFKEYQEKAKTTAVYKGHGTVQGVEYATLGLAGEAGEIANKVKKIQRDDEGEVTASRKQDLFNEIGDVLWYCAALASELGVSLDDIAMNNLVKLAIRKSENQIKGSGDYRTATITSNVEITKTAYGHTWD
jgi:NTP pyrophosphatase (non-canonical NTP hydrolase)